MFTEFCYTSATLYSKTIKLYSVPFPSIYCSSDTGCQAQTAHFFCSNGYQQMFYKAASNITFFKNPSQKLVLCGILY